MLPAPAAQLEAAPRSGAAPDGEVMTDEQLRQLERDNTIAALECAAWRLGGDRGGARLPGVSPSTLKSRMKALDIQRSAR